MEDTIHIDFGVTEAEFKQNYREKSVLLKKGAFPSNLISLQDIDQILYVSEPRAPFVRLHNGTQLSEDLYTESYVDVGMQKKRIIKSKFYELIRSGASLIMNRVETKSLVIKHLCMDVARLMSQQTLGNGYLSFGTKQTFGNHWDTHDVFAVQMLGRKRWKVYKPTFELPLPMQTSLNHKADCPPEPVLDVILEAGDLLYIPRGWWHSATPLNEPTFHVAIGVHVTTAIDYLAWLCGNVLPAHLECRGSVFHNEGTQAELERIADTVRNAILSPENYENFKRKVVSSERFVGPFDLASHITNQTEVLPPDAKLRINSCYVRSVEDSNFTLHGRTNALDEAGLSVLSTIASQSSLRMDDLASKTGLEETLLAGAVYALREQDLIHVEHRG